MAKLITFAYFREETDVSDIVEDKKLDNYIKRAQDRLRELLLSPFYNEIVSQAGTNPKTLSVDNLAFFDPYVKQFIAWQAYEYYIVKANTYETRTGVRVFKEDNSDPASDATMGEQVALAKSDATFYRNAMINFLRSAQKVTPTKYPLFTYKCVDGNSGFGFSAISKIDRVNFKIENQIMNQEP